MARVPAAAVEEDVCSQDESSSQEEMPACAAGSWATDAGESEDSDEDGPIPLVPRLPPTAAQKPQRERTPPMVGDEKCRLWVEDVAFQVGNAAHEMRNVLRFWASLVTQENDKVLIRQFKQADQTSGNLEATMRHFVGRVRNKAKIGGPLRNFVPKGQELLMRIEADLAAINAQRSAAAPEDQRNAVKQLLDRQSAYLAALAALSASGSASQLEQAAAGEKAALPPPGKRVDFGVWGESETQFAARMHEVAAARVPVSPEEVLGLARLACNTSHELQNLATAPRGGLRSEAHAYLRQIDNLAGKCENASRCSMVLVHRARTRGCSRPMVKVAQRGAFLEEAAWQCETILQNAVAADGGHLVPSEAYIITIQRLSGLAKTLQQVEIALEGKQRGPRAPKAERAPRERKFAPRQQCASCVYGDASAVPPQCCKRCWKDTCWRAGYELGANLREQQQQALFPVQVA